MFQKANHAGRPARSRSSALAHTAALAVCAWLATCLPSPAAQGAFFDPIWMGYDAGSSAFPGNPSVFERDPTALAVADFDGDGRLDVAVANYEYAAPGGGTDGMSGFAVLFNEGAGRLGDPVHRTVSNKGCWDIVAGDFDSDGDQDIAVSIADAFWEGQIVRIYHNDGSGMFPTSVGATVEPDPIGLAAADFNGDGHLDLAVANYRTYDAQGAVSILLGNGSGGLAAPVVHPVEARPFQLAAGDLDGNGSIDLAVAHERQAVSLLFNDGVGGFGAPVLHAGLYPLQGGMFHPCVTLADTDRDGDLDVFYANTRSHQPSASTPNIVHLRNHGGAFQRAADIPLTPWAAGPTDLAAGDLNGDDWPDLVGLDFSGRSGDGPRVVMNDGQGGFAPAVAVPGGQTTFAVDLADLDDDGDLDLLGADRYSMAVVVLENPGDGVFPVPPSYDTAGLNIRADMGDVDGDGDLDVFTSTESTGAPGALLRNLGNGIFAPPVTYTHSTTYGRGVARAKLRDLDGDGDLDLLYNDAHTDFQNGYNFHTAMNDGVGNFGPIVEWLLGTGGNGDIDAFDLDNDGDLDVVNCEELCCSPGGLADRLFISRNRGDGTFDPPYTVFISKGPHALIGGDFDEDGNVDLVTTHWMPYGERDFLNVHLGNGDGTLREEVVYPVGGGPRWIVSADFDGDGHLDLATANSGSGDEGRETLTVLFGTGLGTFTGRTDYYAPYSPDLLGATGLSCADIDGDGDMDLMMTTVANGLAIYFNDGNGAFDFDRREGLGWDPWSPLFADFTGDGIPDLTVLTAPQVGSTITSRQLTLMPGVGQIAVDAPLPGGAVRLATGVALSAVRPNPISSTAFFTLDLDATQRVSIAVYDVRGRVVTMLHEGPLAAGATHRFMFDGSRLPAGMYFVRASGETFTAARKALRLR